MKTCTKCGETKPLGAYPKRGCTCKTCGVARTKAWALANPEKAKAGYLKWRNENKVKVAAIGKAYREANPEKNAARGKAYVEANPEKVAARKKANYLVNREAVAVTNKAWKVANRNKVLADQRAYRLANPGKAEAWKSAWHLKNPGRQAETARAYRELNLQAVLLKGRLDSAKPGAKAKKYASHRRRADALTDGYVAGVLGLPTATVTPELLELKREQLTLKRLAREITSTLKKKKNETV